MSAAESIPGTARGLLSSVNDTSVTEMLANTCATTPGPAVKIPQIVCSLFPSIILNWFDQEKIQITQSHVTKPGE